MSERGYIVWLDMEMTGLDAEKERIIEMATTITTADLEIIEEGPDLVIHQSDSLLDAMDEWNKDHHGNSGLIELVRSSTVSETEAEEQSFSFLSKLCQKGMAPLAGNTIHQDRRFLQKYMPRLEQFVHYRNIDVSSVKELARRWYPEAYAKAPRKKELHRARDDIRESIAELKYYRSTIFRPDTSNDS